MKNTTPLSLLISLFFLVFAFTTTTATTADDIVRDSSGDPMKSGGTYVVAPTLSSGGGRIWDGVIRNEEYGTCSLAVIQQPVTYPVLPVNITSPESPDLIRTAKNLFISFADFPHNNCTNNSDWVVSKGEQFSHVMVGDKHHPTGSLFQIMPYDPDLFTYKLVFYDGVLTRNIGVYVDSHSYQRLFVTTGKSLEVQFKKPDHYKGSFASEISMVV